MKIMSKGPKIREYKFQLDKIDLLTDWYWVINVLTVAITDVRITMFACTSTISDALQV